jgi:menaquinone-dependent protoporphyrinogen oxidase
MVKLLIAYASKHGSTAEIARMIGETLRINGMQNDVRTVQEVEDLAEYNALILGSAMYAGEWMDDALDFLHKYQSSLIDMPLWLFSSGPVGEGDPLQLLDGMAVPESVDRLTANLDVREKQVFHGKIDLRKLTLAEMMLFKSVGARTGDYRQWDMIKLWSQSIRDELVATLER